MLCYPLKFELCTVTGATRGISIPAQCEIIRHLVEALAVADEFYLEEHPGTPDLYDSDIYYDSYETRGTEEQWWDIPRILKEGRADCKGLAAWRAAELRLDGVPAQIVVEANRERAGIVFHILVDSPLGLEDPSRELGMQ